MTYDAASGQFDFAIAIAALKDGCKITRHGWNGGAVFAYLVAGEDRSQPSLNIVAADGSVGAWRASHADLLANDWVQLV